MKIQINPNPWLKQRTRFIVSNRTVGRNLFNWLGWYTWAFWAILIIAIVAYDGINFAITPEYASQLSIIDWAIIVWVAMSLPSSVMQFYYWIISRGASNTAMPKVIDGLNAGPLIVELRDNDLKLTRPLLKETIDWSVLTNIFEHRNEIYIASAHNPIVTLPADAPIRQFFLDRGLLA